MICFSKSLKIFAFNVTLEFFYYVRVNGYQIFILSAKKK